MKTTIALITLIISFNTFARSLHPDTFKFKLSAFIDNTFMDIDKNSNLSKLDITGGIVEVDKFKREVSLKLNYAPECPEDAVCAAVLRTQEFTLPLKNIDTDRCNNTHYIAIDDLRPVDGIYQKLTIIDYTSNTCPTFQMLPKTGINYKVSFFNRFSGEEVKFFHSFTADELKNDDLD